jgi:hypothetical protein
VRFLLWIYTSRSWHLDMICFSIIKKLCMKFHQTLWPCILVGLAHRSDMLAWTQVLEITPCRSIGSEMELC